MLYKSQARKNPQTSEVKYYPAVVLSKEPVKLEALIEKIVEATGVTRPDVKSVIAALEQNVIEALRDSRSVRLGDLGSFRPTITGKGKTTAKEVSADCITSVHVHFTPSGYMECKLKPGAEGMAFTRVDDNADNGTPTV